MQGQPKPFHSWTDKLTTEQKEKTQSTDEDDPSLGDFLQNTTFHGIKYIFIDTQFRARRYETLLFASLVPKHLS